MSGFVESTRKEIELPDVAPWVFEVFIGWLYSGRVYRDSPAGADFEDSSKAEGKKRKREANEADETRRVAPRMDIGWTWGGVPPFPGLTNVDIEDHSLPRCPPHEGINTEAALDWEYKDLFQLYIFSDQYDTRRLRMQTTNLIQLKMLRYWGHEGPGLTAESTTYAWNHLPSGAPLRRMLRDFWAKGVEIRDFKSRDSQTMAFEELPKDLLIECLTGSKIHAAALKCKKGRDCEVHKWSFERSRQCGFYDIHPCAYHEHPEESSFENTRCQNLWDILLEEFCDP